MEHETQRNKNLSSEHCTLISAHHAERPDNPRTLCAFRVELKILPRGESLSPRVARCRLNVAESPWTICALYALLKSFKAHHKSSYARHEFSSRKQEMNTYHFENQEETYIISSCIQKAHFSFYFSFCQVVWLVGREKETGEEDHRSSQLTIAIQRFSFDLFSLELPFIYALFQFSFHDLF